MLPGPFICASQESAAPTVTTNIQLRKVKRWPIAPLRSLPQPIISKSERAFCRAHLRNKRLYCSAPVWGRGSVWIIHINHLIALRYWTKRCRGA